MLTNDDLKAAERRMEDDLRRDCSEAGHDWTEIEPAEIETPVGRVMANRQCRRCDFRARRRGALLGGPTFWMDLEIQVLPALSIKPAHPWGEA